MKEKNLFISKHPLVAHKLSLLRDKNTEHSLFRQLIYEISLVLAMEATQSLSVKNISVTTPLSTTSGKKLLHIEPIIIPILRAGLGMQEAFLTLLPTAKVGYVVMKRDEISHQANCYYFNVPVDDKASPCFVVDPMLATGGSAVHTITKLKNVGLSNITMVSIVAAPEGVLQLQSVHPQVPIYTASLDEKLNDAAFIFPGLGDAGDRLYGTK